MESIGKHFAEVGQQEIKELKEKLQKTENELEETKKQLAESEPSRKVPKVEVKDEKSPSTSGDDKTPEVNFDRAVVLQDISVTIPERKKFNLIFTSAAIYAAKELKYPFTPEHTFPLKEISSVLSVPVPEKAKPQYNVVLYKNNNSVAALQFTLLDAYAEKFLRLPSPAEGKKDVKVLDLMNFLFTNNFSKPVVQSNMQNCVEAHRGSKEGYLYLMDGFIFFGIKKPLLLFDINNIESISYSSIIRLTFNLIIKLVEPLPEFSNQTEYEFSMIDQKEYDKIDKYVADNELSNQSMSEARRARISAKDIVSNEIKKAIEEEGVDVADEDQGNGISTVNDINPNESSDDEELDQNYEGSESDDGSGSSSEEEEEEGEGEEAARTDDGDGDDDDDDMNE